MTVRRRLTLICVSVLMLLTATGCWGTEEQRVAPVGEPRQELPAPDPTDVLYVSTTGHDDWEGTKRRPWRTLSRALPALLAGQTLYVRGGVYREQVLKLDLHEGSRRRRIVVRAYPGERPVVRGLFWLSGPSYWTIDGLDVTWDRRPGEPPRHMVKITGGVGWVWRNSEIWGARTGANVLITGGDAGEPARWSFTGNCVHDLRPPRWVQRGSNLTVGDMAAAGPGRVTDNLIFAAPGGRNITLGEGRRGMFSGPTDVTVAYNTVYGGSVAIALAGTTSDVLIERNLLGGPASGTLLRASRLRGEGVVVRENLGVQAARFFLPDTGSLRRGPGNILVDNFRFRDTSGCRGFRPTTVVSAYGRGAVG